MSYLGHERSDGGAPGVRSDDVVVASVRDDYQLFSSTVRSREGDVRLVERDEVILSAVDDQERKRTASQPVLRVEGSGIGWRKNRGH